MVTISEWSADMWKLLIALFGAVTLAGSGIATAHVLITDESKIRGAVLHITPDDDPVAGQPSTLYFDMQDREAPYQEGEVRLRIHDEHGTSQPVDVQLTDTLASATHVFPSQGLYRLEFTVGSDDGELRFVHSQRVARGVSTGVVAAQTHAWAEVLLLTGVVGLAVLVIVAFNRRAAIASQSRF